MFRGSELVRLASMAGLLAVLGLMIVRARDPAMWQWFAREQGAVVDDAAVATPAQPAAPEIAPPTGPTDEDPEQLRDVAEEYEAVVDGSIGIQPEDMLAYWRLFYWVEHQSTDRLLARAAKNVYLTELMQRPQQHRGKLLRLELHVRRVLSYEVEDSPLETSRLYEIWGWSDEAKAWLYCVVTAELPPGMPIGPSVEECATFVGYFFKLQGYYEAGAKPRAAPLKAPLLVGRLIRHPSLTDLRQKQTGSDAWLWALLGGVVLILAALGIGQYRSVRTRANPRQAAREANAGQTVRQWLREEYVSPSAISEPNALRDPHPDGG